MSATSYWDEIPRILALAGQDPTAAGWLRQSLKMWTLGFFADLDATFDDADEIKDIYRKWITGFPS